MKSRKFTQAIFLGFVYVFLLSFFGCQEGSHAIDYIELSSQAVKSLSFLIK